MNRRAECQRKILAAQRDIALIKIACQLVDLMRDVYQLRYPVELLMYN
jgi:hypothetical protein